MLYRCSMCGRLADSRTDAILDIGCGVSRCPLKTAMKQDLGAQFRNSLIGIALVGAVIFAIGAFFSAAHDEALKNCPYSDHHWIDQNGHCVPGDHPLGPSHNARPLPKQK
jgi:hypothetical protein